MLLLKHLLYTQNLIYLVYFYLNMYAKIIINTLFVYFLLILLILL